MRSFILAISVALLTAGCFPKAPYVPQRQPLTGVSRIPDEIISVDKPAPGSKATVNIGEPIMVSGKIQTSYHLDVATSLTLHDDYNVDGETEYTYSVHIPRGRFTIENIDRSGNKFATIGLVDTDWLFQGKYYESFKVTAHFRLRNDGIIDLVWSQEGTARLVPIAVPDAEQKLKVGSRSVPDRSAVRRELVYTGRSGGNLTILYREFINDMARPAFSQQLQYDISKDAVIGYQGARFRVIEATNTSITYEVLSKMSESTP